MNRQVHKWTLPSNYGGATWYDWYGSGFGRSRDSDTLEESNFQVAWNKLKATRKDIMDGDGEEMDSVQIIREGHWAVGWVEWIGIHESDEESLAVARGLCERYDEYPALDEGHWSELEYERAMGYWDSCPMAERVQLCQQTHVSVFAARRSHDLPDRLYEMLAQ